MARLACLLVVGCGQGERIAGNGSETTSGLSARILDAQGRPSAGARVEVRPSTWTAAEGDGFDPVRWTTAGPDGVARFATLPSGDWSLVALSEGAGAAARVDRAASTSDSRLELRLEPLASARGVVGPVGAGGGWVAVEGTGRLVRTDSAGAFLIDSLPPSSLVLRYATDRGLRGSARVRLSGGLRGEVGTLAANDRSADPPRTDSVKILVDLGGQRADTLLGYPLLVRLTDTALDFSRTRGADLSIHRRGGRLAHEVEDWNSAAREAVLWVRVDTILPTDRNLTLVLAYGGSDLPDWASSSEVFAERDGWRAVWHLAARDPGKEATGRHRARDWRTLEAPGVAGTGRFCDTGWLRVPDAPALRPRSLTLSAWVLPGGIRSAPASS